MIKRIALILPFTASLASACPLCRDSLSQPQAAGFNSSITWMLCGTALVLGMIVRQITRFKD